MTKELLMSLFSRWLYEQPSEKKFVFSEIDPIPYLPAFASNFQVLALSCLEDELSTGVIVLAIDYDPLFGMCINGWFQSDNSVIDIWRPTAKLNMSEYSDITGIDSIMKMLLKHNNLNYHKYS